jgi:hypothetical protein
MIFCIYNISSLLKRIKKINLENNKKGKSSGFDIKIIHVNDNRKYNTNYKMLSVFIMHLEY